MCLRLYVLSPSHLATRDVGNNELPTKETRGEWRMLRWMCGVTKKDKIRNGHVRGSVKVEPTAKKITKKRLKWYGDRRIREEGPVLRRMADAPIRRRRRGTQKTR